MPENNISGPDQPVKIGEVAESEGQHKLKCNSKDINLIVHSFEYGGVHPRSTYKPVKQLIHHICEHVRCLSVFGCLRSIANWPTRIRRNILNPTLRERHILSKMNFPIIPCVACYSTHSQVGVRPECINPIHSDSFLIKLIARAQIF